jgi:hypothetical protein
MTATKLPRISISLGDKTLLSRQLESSTITIDSCFAIAERWINMNVASAVGIENVDFESDGFGEYHFRRYSNGIVVEVFGGVA